MSTISYEDAEGTFKLKITCTANIDACSARKQQLLYVTTWWDGLCWKWENMVMKCGQCDMWLAWSSAHSTKTKSVGSSRTGGRPHSHADEQATETSVEATISAQTISVSASNGCLKASPRVDSNSQISTESNEAAGHLLQQSVPRPTLTGFEATRSAGRRSEEHSSLPTLTSGGEANSRA